MSIGVEEIRLYSKDIPMLNVLLEGELQSGDKLIALAMQLAVNDFNIVPPLTRYTVNRFPSDTILIYGTMHHLCNAEAERQLRNQMNYAAQGVTAGLDDKFPQYNQLAQYYKSLFDQKIAEFKQYLNMNKAWGGSFSPFININEWNFRD